MRLKDRPGGSFPSIWCFSMRMFFWKISGDALMGECIIRRARRERNGPPLYAPAQRWVYYGYTIGDDGEGDHVHEDPLDGGKHSSPVEPVGLRIIIKPHH